MEQSDENRDVKEPPSEPKTYPQPIPPTPFDFTRQNHPPSAQPFDPHVPRTASPDLPIAPADPPNLEAHQRSERSWYSMSLPSLSEPKSEDLGGAQEEGDLQYAQPPSDRGGWRLFLDSDLHRDRDTNNAGDARLTASLLSDLLRPSQPQSSLSVTYNRSLPLPGEAGPSSPPPPLSIDVSDFLGMLDANCNVEMAVYGRAIEARGWAIEELPRLPTAVLEECGMLDQDVVVLQAAAAMYLLGRRQGRMGQ